MLGDVSHDGSMSVVLSMLFVIVVDVLLLRLARCVAQHVEIAVLFLWAYLGPVSRGRGRWTTYLSLPRWRTLSKERGPR